MLRKYDFHNILKTCIYKKDLYLIWKKPYYMKKLLLIITILITLTSVAQSTQKQVEISKKFKVMVKKIKSNNYFDFIAEPQKMTEIYDCNGSLEYYKINGENYFIKIDQDDNISIFYNNGEYHFNFVDNDLIGHGYVLDTREKQLSVYYFQNEKTVKKNTVSKT